MKSCEFLQRYKPNSHTLVTVTKVYLAVLRIEVLNKNQRQLVLEESEKLNKVMGHHACKKKVNQHGS